MNAIATTHWHEANQRYLMARLAVVRDALTRHASHAQDTTEQEVRDQTTAQAVHEATHALPGPSALDTLCDALALSPFERDLLLLCAGVELDASFAALCAMAQGDPQRAYPTFSLALSALPEGHWSALTPTAPLRRWRLIEVGAGEVLTTSPLRIDERVLHYLAGVSYLDTRLHGLIKPLPSANSLPESHRELAQRITASWSQAQDSAACPIIQLCGDRQAEQHAVASYACAALGLQLHTLHAADIPLASAEREALARLWEREVILDSKALLLDCNNMENVRLILSFIEDLHSILIVTSHKPLSVQKRTALRLDVQKLSAAEQYTLWQDTLGPLASRMNGHLDRLVAQFNLGIEDIRATSIQVLEATSQRPEEALGLILWDACRMQVRQRLDDLAQRIEPVADWDDLVLPEHQLQTLCDIAAHVRQRAKVYETWGFASKGSHGLGISALFAGTSGTGKTLAAEVLANELRLDLYRIDLSQVVSKYIGETEKNLRRVFDAAEESGAMLLFDEADALFGKRSEVKDSHDRYANIEVSYLLQRMEAYRGLAILTTNMKSALDIAFFRRIRFIVQFPFPDVTQRAEIWRRVFPENTPTSGLDIDKLAQLNVAGGNIYNIALHAAFLAADAGEPVRMTHLLYATHQEYAKLEKPLTESQSRGWI